MAKEIKGNAFRKEQLKYLQEMLSSVRYNSTRRRDALERAKRRPPHHIRVAIRTVRNWEQEHFRAIRAEEKAYRKRFDKLWQQLIMSEDPRTLLKPIEAFVRESRS